MSELKDLYQEVIFDHNKHPQNFGVMEHADHRADGHNPLCGDKIEVYVKMNGDVIEDIMFDGSGCAISRASASILTTAVKGKTKDEAAELFKNFDEMLKDVDMDAAQMELLGKLAVFEGVKEFPTRIKCASLSWHTIDAAINNKGEIATTE